MTEPSRQPTLRTLIILLAVVDLAVLGMRLWPWSEVMGLPGNGATGIDPAITLVGYTGLAFWIGTAREEPSRKSLFSAGWLGVLAGMFLVAQVVLATQQSSQDSPGGLDRVQIGLMACAAVVIAIAGLRTSRAGFTIGFSTVCSLWASMVASLMAVAAVLGETYRGTGAAASSDAWKQYEGLAIGSQALQDLVHALDTITGLLLVGPLIGCIAGAIFASFGKREKA